MKISKRANIKEEDRVTTDNWNKLKSSIKVCKYCKKTPTARFDEEEEMYYMEFEIVPPYVRIQIRWFDGAGTVYIDTFRRN